jgi:hypothetical protein
MWARYAAISVPVGRGLLGRNPYAPMRLKPIRQAQGQAPKNEPAGVLVRWVSLSRFRLTGGNDPEGVTQRPDHNGTEHLNNHTDANYRYPVHLYSCSPPVSLFVVG